jgi:probable rRNA maturation factor
MPVASRPTGPRTAPDVRVSALVRAPLGRAAIARLAAAVLRAERARVASLSVTLVGPARIRTLNRMHLGHDRVTDVIAFAYQAGTRSEGRGTRASGSPLAPRPTSLVGDIYICPAVAARHARTFGTTAREELRRLVVHAVLHVTGHDHPAGAARTASPMWRRQERYLARFGIAR